LSRDAVEQSHCLPLDRLWGHGHIVQKTMLALSKKTDYALIALAHLSERPGRVASARQIARTYELPPALLMNILKDLHHRGFLDSIRGTKGGYRLAIDPHQHSLYELVRIVDGDVHLTDCAPGGHAMLPVDATCRISGGCPIQSPIHALHHRLVGFLQDVKLSDLILPGQRIDVPLEALQSGRAASAGG
jgi:Rrf2 family protein